MKDLLIPRQAAILEPIEEKKEHLKKHNGIYLPSHHNEIETKKGKVIYVGEDIGDELIDCIVTYREVLTETIKLPNKEKVVFLRDFDSAMYYVEPKN